MATTTNWSITYPTTANNITPLATHFANLASSTDTAITSARNQIGRYSGTDAQRLALTAATGRTEGTEWYSTDTDRQWMFDGSAWITNEPGLYVITPASAPTGYSVGADGSLIASNLSTGFRNFDGIFSARFRNYRAEITLVKTLAAVTSDMNGRAGGTTVTDNAHYFGFSGVINNAATQGTGGPTGSFSNVADAQGNYNYSVLEIGSPFISTEPTYILSQQISRGGVLGHLTKSSNLETLTSLTGLSINFGQTVTSARIRFYGYV